MAEPRSTDRNACATAGAIAWTATALMLPLTTPALAGSFDSFNIELISHLELSTATDITSDGDRVYVGRGPDGASIIDITSPASPSVITTWQHPSVSMNVQDLRVLNGDLWLSNESFTDFGVVGLDLTTPVSPSIITTLAPPDFPLGVHNMWPYQDHLYLSGYVDAGGNVIVNLTNPASPVLAARIEVGIHDVNVVDGVLYIAGGFDGTYLYDVADPTNPIQLETFDPSDADTLYYQHNAYPIGSTGYVVVTEEVQQPAAGGGFTQGSVRVWDLNLDPPAPVWRWKSETAKTDPNVTPHNAYVIGSHLYLSAYQDGLKIFDVTEPSDPVEVAFFDTFPQLPTGLFEGCWGVDPFQGNERIFLSDRQNGYFHVAFNGARRATLDGRVLDAITMQPLAGVTVEDLTAQRSFTSGGDGTFTEKSGEGAHDYLIEVPGYQDLSTTVVLVANQTTSRDFLMVPTAVSTDEAPGVVGLRLRAARPNPFTPRTTLGFDVPADLAGERVSIRVFDARGQLVRTLLDGAAAAGEGAVSWDGRNDAGFRMGSGAYLARMEVDGRVETRKLILTR